MDIEFIVQDIFALTRPQWKLASNIEEAGEAFRLAMVQDQKTSGTEKSVEPEELELDDSSDEAVDDREGHLGAADDDGESSDDDDTDVSNCCSGNI
jgi:regulator of nonsense transcripts 2